ncbi:hypothetical protein ACIBTZ_08890 [Micromonospora sp. NPDC049460]|uniref:hypothetical protein n=1 Tax=Micromonospora sp. NPDC049460 TaxID=3364272 RepID=UPI0037943881
MYAGKVSIGLDDVMSVRRRPPGLPSVLVGADRRQTGRERFRRLDAPAVEPEVALAVGPEVALAVGPEVALAVGPEVALAVGPEVALADGRNGGWPDRNGDRPPDEVSGGRSGAG